MIMINMLGFRVCMVTELSMAASAYHQQEQEQEEEEQESHTKELSRCKGERSKHILPTST
jgi:hypothetical protein